MKVIKKNILAGVGRALGFIIVYATLALVLKGMGISIDINTYPPSIEGEILSTIKN